MRRWIAILVVLGGCGSVLGIDDIDERPPCFGDGFSALDSGRWALTGDGSVVTVDLVDGNVVIAPPPNVGGLLENGIVTLDELDLTDATLTATVRTESLPEPLVTFFLFDVRPGTGLGFLANGGTLIARTYTNGNVSDPLDPPRFDAQQIYWRLRHDSARGEVTFEVSANLVDWNTIRVADGYPAPLVGTARLQGGVYDAPSADPGQAAFDAIELAADGCVSVSAD